MRTFQYINRDIVNPIDLNTLSKTYSTLEQGHQQAVKAASDLQIEMAKLPLNEAEDAWRQQRISEIQQTIADNTTFGNAYGALDDIIAKAGNLSSDAGMIGRLRAQQDYKTYLDNLNKRTDLPEADKEYFREKNKYYYADKYDDKGNVIGGSKWTPIEQEVASPDMVKMMGQAIRIAAKDAGGSNTVYYKDASGNYTTNSNLSVDGLPYVNKSGKYEKLTKEKLMLAMDSVIANTPGAIEGLEQDYKVANWRHNKNNVGGVDETTDEKGLKLNFNQYLEKRLTGFYQSASYSHYYSEVTPLEGMSVKAANARQAASSVGYGDVARGIADARNTTPGDYTIRKTSALSGVVAQRLAATEMLKGVMNNAGIEFDINDVDGSYNRLKDYYKQNGEIVPKGIYDAYNAYKEGVDAYNQLLSNADEDVRDMAVFTSALENGVDLSMLKDSDGNLNPYAKQLVELHNKAFGDKDEIPIYLKGNFDETIQQIPDYKEYGLRIKTDSNGKKYLSFNKENVGNSYIVANLIKDVIKPTYDVTAVTLYGPVKTYTGNSDYFSKVKKLYDKTSKAVDKVINLNNEPIPAELVSEYDVVETIVTDGYNNGKWSDINAARKDIREHLGASLDNVIGQRIDIAVGKDGHPLEYGFDSSQRFSIMEAIKRIRTADPASVNISYDKNTLDTFIKVRLTDDIKNDDVINSYLRDANLNNVNTFTIRTPNLFNDPAKNDLMSSTQFRHQKQFTDLVDAGVYSFGLPDGSAIITDGTGNYGIQRGNSISGITRQDAIDAYSASKFFEDARYTYNAVVNMYGEDNIPTDINNSLGSTILNIVKSMSVQDKNITSIEELSPSGKYLYNKLINSLVNE